MFKVLIPLLLLLTSSMVLLSCATAGRSEQVEPAAKPVAEQANTEKPAASGWEVEWQETLKAAKKEGAVSAYSTINPEVRTAISNGFKQKFGLDIEWVAGKSGEMAEKLMRERRNGIYWADLATGGTSTALLVLRPAGVLDRIEPELILPEVKDTKAWYQGSLPFFDREGTIFSFRADITHTVLINTTLAKKEEFSSYRDLLNTKWNKKIAWYDPTIGGSGNQFFSIVGGKILGYDYMKELAKQEPAFSKDKRQLVEWVAKGKYIIGLGAESGSILEFKNAGAPVQEFTPKEGAYMTSGSGNLHIYNKPAHPNARKIFINWLLSAEGQLIWSRVGNVQSARIDLPTDHIPLERVRQAEMKYFMADTEEWEAEKEKRFTLAWDIFGHLLK